MALVLNDRVRETSPTTGTGTITLAGAAYGYQSFASIGNGNITYYTIFHINSGAWEVGYGTYTASGTTLSRDFVYSSSNAGALVNFGAGTKDVFVTYPSEQAIYQETNGSLKLVGGTIGLTQDGTEGTTLPNTSFQAFTTGNYYMQANQQNLSSGAEASSDWVATADNGTDTEFYMDMGMASSGYNFPGFSAFKANSGYVVSTGSDLRIIAGKYGATTGSPGAQDIVLVAGTLLDTEERMRVKGLTGNIILGGINPTDTGQKLQVVGTAKVTGATTFGSTVTLNANPVGNLEAATKQYVDTAAATGFTVHDAVRLTTAAALPANTYNNGVAGVGATLTAVANGALSIDGVAVATSDRVLVKNEAAPANNGSYSVTATGSAGAPYVLTRTTDFDQAAASEIANNAYFFVSAGSTNAGSAFILSQTAVIVVGTTALPFTLFADQLNYVGGTNIDVTGLTISLTGTVAPSNGGTGINSYANGDTIYASGAATFSKLPIGTTGQTMIVAGGFPAWGALNLAGAGVSGVLPATKGGTSQSSYAIGDLLYSSATNTLAKLAGNTTTTKQYLSQTGTGSASAAPSWAAVAAADITGLAPSATIDTTNAANITTGALPSGRLVGGYTGVTAVGTLAGLDVSGTAVIAANSATDALRITQTGTGNAFVVEDSASPDSTPFVIDNVGNVGVGTTSNPQNSKLMVGGTVQVKPATNNSLEIFGPNSGTGIRLFARNDAGTLNRLELQGGQVIFPLTSGADGLYFDASSGNVGIGTSSPSYRLQVSSTNNTTYSSTNTLGSGAVAYIQNASTTVGTAGTLRLEALGPASAAAISISAVHTGDGAAALTFGNRPNSASDLLERMRIDSAGNLGLGVTPSVWSQGRAFEVFQNGYGVWNGDRSAYLMANAYFNSGFKYAISGNAASHYYQFQGAHVWSTAPSGTAGDAISFTQAMTLDASGRLLVGRTSSAGSAYSLELDNGTSDNRIGMFAGGTLTGGLLCSTNEIRMLGLNASTVLTFQTNGSERARIDSAGNVGVGTTTPQTVTGASYSASWRLFNVSAADNAGLIAAASQGPARLHLSAGTVSSTANNRNWFITSEDSSLKFQSATDALTATERMRINSAGAVSFGSSGTAFGTAGQILTSNGSGASPSFQTPAAAGGFPAGTLMLFQQTAAPTGWTKQTTHNDKALRVVSGTAGSGGTVAFTTAFASKAVAGTVGNTTLSTAQMPSHSHSIPGNNLSCGTAPTTTAGDPASNSSGATGGGGSHNHSFTGTAIDLAVQYVDLIIASKD